VDGKNFDFGKEVFNLCYCFNPTLFEKVNIDNNKVGHGILQQFQQFESAARFSRYLRSRDFCDDISEQRAN